MRPNNPEAGVELYECFDCGERTTDPPVPTCEHCGGDLRNLGRSRDL
ncbi:rubrerythrin-like domain-containing protein [Natronomonas salina]|nr:rubrerythrin-like domain-containing protein [Natronomonas salina]QLD90958.1 rubrerythrin-like domain-containing protein [Natronomonas salina]